MIITTIIEVGIDIDDPIGQCDDEHIKHAIETKYQGKCFRECYIKSVNRIIKKGELIINQMSETAFSTVPIIVEVTAVVFPKGEIITGCKITHINDRAKLITCETEFAYLMLKSDNAFSSLQIGQFINVQVGLTQYSIGMPKAVINGAVYLPNDSQPIYEIIEPTMPTEQELKDVMTRIEFEEGEAKKLAGEKSWTIFSALVYAYSSPQKVEAINILSDHGKLNKKYITRDCRIQPTTPYVLAVDEAPVDRPWKQQNIHKVTMKEAIIAVLEDYVGHLRIVREMISVYSTADLIKSHGNLWAIYRMNKIDKKE